MVSSYKFVDLSQLSGHFLVLQVLKLLPDCLGLTLLKYAVNSEKHLPKHTFDQSGYDIHNGDMHYAEIDHDIAEVLRISPGMVKGDH